MEASGESYGFRSWCRVETAVRREQRANLGSLSRAQTSSLLCGNSSREHPYRQPLWAPPWALGWLGAVVPFAKGKVEPS